MRAIITAVCHYVPEKKLTNRDLERLVDTNDEWITTRTGIKERRILAADKGTSYMAVRAVRMILKQRQISADEIDLIIIATVTPDRTVPPTAALVQKELKARNCWGYDVNGACSGFLFALASGMQFIESGRHRKVIVIGADKMSAIIDYQDRNTCILFGDGAGAVLLEPALEDDQGIKDFILNLDGDGADYLHIAAGGSLVPTTHETVANKMHYLYQDGKTVFKHAVSGMADVVTGIIKKNRLGPADITHFIPHQANFRIIDAVAKKVGLRADQVMLNIEKYGNTTAATIPLAMSEAYRQGRMHKGDWIVLSAFGAGFTWGSMLLKWAMD
jgi:3-oxoacyl-[acyl-carrier-protein] synthase-3